MEKNKNARIEMNLKMKRDGKNWRRKCAMLFEYRGGEEEEKNISRYLLCECVDEDELIKLVTVLHLKRK
jgi:hypothetical protein